MSQNKCIFLKWKCKIVTAFHLLIINYNQISILGYYKITENKYKMSQYSVESFHKFNLSGILIFLPNFIHLTNSSSSVGMIDSTAYVTNLFEFQDLFGGVGVWVQLPTQGT